MKKSITKKIAFVMALVLAFALTSAITANAAVGDVKKFSFNSGLSAAGWTQGRSVYDDAVGYGMVAAPGKTAGLATMGESANEAGVIVGVNTDADADLLNAVGQANMADTNGTDTIFKVKLAAGTYKVTVYAGGISNNNTYNPNVVYVDDVVATKTSGKAVKNSDKTIGSILLTTEDFKYESTVTLAAEKVLEIKAVNPKTTITDAILAELKAQNPKCTYEVGGECGGRSYLNAVMIEEVAPVTAAADTTAATGTAVPATGETAPIAFVAALAVACAGAAILVFKKRKEA